MGDREDTLLLRLARGPITGGAIVGSVSYVTKKKLAFREAPCLEAVAGVEPATFARVIPRGVYRAVLFHLSYTARRRAGAFTLGEWAPRVA